MLFLPPVLALASALAGPTPAAPEPVSSARVAASRGPEEAAARDLEEVLAQLLSDSAVDRWRAERWLSGNLTAASYPDLAAAADAGDAELRRRLAGAIGREDRHLDLAVLFAGERRPQLFQLGRQALGDHVSRHAEELFAAPVRGRELTDRLADLDDQIRVRALELEPFTTLTEALDRIGRLGGAALPLVTDPELEGDRLVPPVTGTWEQLLAYLAHEVGVGLEGHALGKPGEFFPFGFLRICRLRDAGHRSGAELLMQWAVDSEHHPNPDRRANSARALADAGWPGALEWLGRRWAAQRDDASLAGICRAAARDRVVPELVHADVVRELLADVDAHLGSADRYERDRAHEVLRALAAVPPVDAQGGSLARVVLEGWEGLDDRRRWARLVVLEGMRSGDAEVARTVRGELERAQLPAGLARQALRAFVALPGEREAPALVDELALFRDARSEAELREAVRLLALARVEVEAPEPSESDAGEWEPAAHAALAARYLMAGRVERAARHLRDSGAFELEGSALGLEARRAQLRVAEYLHSAVQAGRRAAVLELLSTAADSLEARWPADRLRALIELLPAAEHEALADALEAGDPADPIGWGALAAGPQGRRAWQALEEQLADALESEFDPVRADQVETGLEQGLQRMLSETGTWRIQRQKLRDLTREFPEHPLTLVMGSAAWPAPPGERPLGLRSRDRELPRGL